MHIIGNSCYAIERNKFENKNDLVVTPFCVGINGDTCCLKNFMRTFKSIPRLFGKKRAASS